MIASFLRVIVGFALACLLAALTKVFFAFSPAELANLPPDVAQSRISLALPVATHLAIFSAPFAVLAALIGEWRGWRDWTYYAIVGMAIALVGFFAQYSAETALQGWSITSSNYPLITFLTTGFVGGLAYWLFAGRFAGSAARNAHHHAGAANHRHDNDGHRHKDGHQSHGHSKA